MNFLKKNIRSIIGFIVGVILASSITVHAYSYIASDVKYIKKDGTEISVEKALNELYSKKNNEFDENIESVLTLSSQNIDYTFTVEQEGTYLVGIVNCDDSGKKGTITTESEVILEEFLGNENIAFGRTATIKLLESKKNDKITIKGYNGGNDASAFIYKLNNINISSIVKSDLSNDETASLSYTANKNNEQVIVLGVGFGRDKTSSITYNGSYLSQERKNGNFSIGYVLLSKDSSATVSSYGYEHGGGMVFILK